MSSRKLLAWTQRFAALALVAFWISFWADNRDLPPNVVDMEWSFLIPDIAWIAIAFWIASRWLIARDPRAAIATAVAGGSLVYLGLLDVVSNVRHHQYTESLSRGTVNGIVNLACLVFGCVNIWYALQQRDA